MADIVHAAAAKWYKAGEAGGVTTAPTHSHGAAYLRASHLVVGDSHSFFTAVWIRARKLDGASLADESRHTLELSHFLQANIVRVLHGILIASIVI